MFWFWLINEYKCMKNAKNVTQIFKNKATGDNFSSRYEINPQLLALKIKT